MDEKALKFLYELKKILSSENSLFEIAYNRDACDIDGETEYLLEVLNNLNDYLFELELKNGN